MRPSLLKNRNSKRTLPWNLRKNNDECTEITAWKTVLYLLPCRRIVGHCSVQLETPVWVKTVSKRVSVCTFGAEIPILWVKFRDILHARTSLQKYESQISKCKNTHVWNGLYFFHPTLKKYVKKNKKTVKSSTEKTYKNTQKTSFLGNHKNLFSRLKIPSSLSRMLK